MVESKLKIDVQVYLNNKPIPLHSLKTRLGFLFLRLARKCLVIDMDAGLTEISFPPNVLVVTEYDGSQWVMLEDYQALLERR